MPDERSPGLEGFMATARTVSARYYTGTVQYGLGASQCKVCSLHAALLVTSEAGAGPVLRGRAL